jgi:hypothetical protein
MRAEKMKEIPSRVPVPCFRKTMLRLVVDGTVNRRGHPKMPTKEVIPKSSKGVDGASTLAQFCSSLSSLSTTFSPLQQCQGVLRYQEI